MEQEPLTDPSRDRRSLFVRHREEFVRRFGGSPRGVALLVAPGRVNLLGAHLDYNGGPVLPMAIDRGTFLALRPRADRQVTLASTVERERLETDLDHLPTRASGRWYDYPLGVLQHLIAAGHARTGFELLYGGDLPIGAGLSSSASICVGTAHALLELWGEEPEPHACIEAALYGEREFVGVRCGIMDPFAVALTRPGHLLWVDCRDQSVEHLPLDADLVTVAVADTGVRRGLALGAFNQRVEECAHAFAALRVHSPGAECLRDITPEVLAAHGPELDPVLRRRAEHVVSEVGRTYEARRGLLSGDLELFGRCLTGAHESLRDLFEVSIPELDLLVDTAREWDGFLGGRLTGAGFGGCAVLALRTASVEGFQDHLGEAFEARFGRRPPVDFFQGSGGPTRIEFGD